MDMISLLQMLPEDLSDHHEQCLYRRFMKGKRESNFHTLATMEKELRTKYKVEVALSRCCSRNRKSGGRKRVSTKRNPLTPDEAAWINAKVEHAMKHDGPIQWYLESQRQKFQGAKERIKQLCECANLKISVDTTTDQAEPSNGRVMEVDVESELMKLMTAGEDSEMKEDGVSLL